MPSVTWGSLFSSVSVAIGVLRDEGVSLKPNSDMHPHVTHPHVTHPHVTLSHPHAPGGPGD